MRLLLIIAIAVIICIFTSTSIDASNLRKLRATIDVKSESSMTLSTPPAWMVAAYNKIKSGKTKKETFTTMNPNLLLKLKWTCYHHRTKIKHCPLDKCPKHYYKPGESHEKFGAPAPPPNDSKGGGTISGSVNSGSYYGHGSATIPHLIERSSDMIYSGKHNMDTYVALTTLEALQVVCTCKFVCNKPKQDEPKLLLEMDAMTDADADAEAEADIEALSEASMDDEFEVGVQADTDTEAEGSVDASTDAVAGTKFETALEADMNADEGLEQDMEMETDIDTENNALSESESASALSVYNPPPQWLLTVYNDIKAGKGKKYAIHKLDVLHRLALEWTCYNHRKKIKHCPLNDCPKHYYKPGEDHEKFPAPKGPPNNGYHGGTVSYHVGGGGSSPYPHGAVTVPHLIERSSTMSHNENHQLKQHHDMDTYVGLTTLEALQLVCTCKFVCNKPKGEPFSKQVLAAFGVLMEMGTHVNTDADVGVYAKIDNDIELDSDADADIDADTDADVDAEEAFFLQQEMDGYG